MFKSILTAATVVALTFNAQAQDNVDQVWEDRFESVVPIEKADYGKWVSTAKQEDPSKITIVCVNNQTAVGYQKMLLEANRILEAVGENLFNPDTDQSFLVSYADGLTDYNNVSMSLKVESSSIYKIWSFENENGDKYELHMKGTKKFNALYLCKIL